jgi:hypothetical protein
MYLCECAIHIIILCELIVQWLLYQFIFGIRAWMGLIRHRSDHEDAIAIEGDSL